MTTTYITPSRKFMGLFTLLLLAFQTHNEYYYNVKSVRVENCDTPRRINKNVRLHFSSVFYQHCNGWQNKHRDFIFDDFQTLTNN